MSSFRDSSECSQSEIVEELLRTYWQFRGGDKPDKPAAAWAKLAAYIADKPVIPSRYVRWAYHEIRVEQPIPWPQQIAAPARVDAFLREERQYVDGEVMKIRVQLDILHHQLASGRTIQEIVEDDLLDLGDAVRYAVARKAGMADSAERLKRWADLDLLNEPVYECMLSSFL